MISSVVRSGRQLGAVKVMQKSTVVRSLATVSSVNIPAIEAPTIETIYPESSFQLGSGKTIDAGRVRIKYAMLGDPGMPKILICPSMSNSVHVVDGFDPDDGSEHVGWWNGVVGHGDEFGINLDKYHVIVGAPMGSPFGSTSPLTPGHNGEAPLGPDFPQITPYDMAVHQKLLLEQLGIDKVFAVVGGSMGGMQVNQFAVHFPEMYDRFVSIASTAHTAPGIVALRSVQRQAVKMDPDYMEGKYEVNPTKGMAIARMFGTICYRSRGEFDERFDWFPTPMQNDTVSFEVERYLQHQALKFTENVNYDANCYLLLSQAMDLQDISLGKGFFEDAVANIPATKEALLLPYDTDTLTPAHDLERFATALGSSGVRVHFETLLSKFGHDAFLIEKESRKLNSRISTFLAAPNGRGVEATAQLVKDLHGH